jgi:hypothetical protein
MWFALSRPHGGSPWRCCAARLVDWSGSRPSPAGRLSGHRAMVMTSPVRAVVTDDDGKQIRLALYGESGLVAEAEIDPGYTRRQIDEAVARHRSRICDNACSIRSRDYHLSG